MTTTAPPARINPTRPENLQSSNKRTSRQQLLSLYSQLLPLEPTTSHSSPASSLSFFTTTSNSLTSPSIEATWDEITQSVWVTKDDQMQRLWRQGFFGKGFLSRSEPSWKRRVENRRATLEGREKRLTSEEITQQRRLERKGTKLVKKLERDAEKFLAATQGTSSSSDSTTPASSTVSSSIPSLETVEKEEGGKGKGKGKGKEELEGVPSEVLKHSLDEVVQEKEEEQGRTTEETKPEEEKEADEEEEEEEETPPEPWQLEAEHTQLQPEEAFFLLFALGCLDLRRTSIDNDNNDTSERVSIISAFTLFLQNACPTFTFPSRPSPTSTLTPSPPPIDPRLTRLDSPFFLSYAAYHHYRSMGWVVRSGVKFCVDWVLYGPGGPVGSHAEFAVLVLPTYVDPQDELTSPFRTSSHLAYTSDPELQRTMNSSEEEVVKGEEHLRGEGERRNSWKWFHTVNRVCSGVKKTLVLLHVVIPPLSSLSQEDPNWLSHHPAQALAKLEMREVVVRRFLAGRMRD